MPAWLTASGENWTLHLHVQPGARRTEVQGAHGEALKLRLAAPPVDGKANAELLRFLAEALGLPRARLTLVAGQASRAKRVRLGGPLAAAAIVSALWDDERLGPAG